MGDSCYMGSLVGNGNDSINHELRLDSWWVKQELFDGKLSSSAGQISGFDFFGYIPQDFSYSSLLDRSTLRSRCTTASRARIQ